MRARAHMCVRAQRTPPAGAGTPVRSAAESARMAQQAVRVLTARQEAIFGTNRRPEGSDVVSPFRTH